MEYYALDYVNPVCNECELVYDDQLYASKLEIVDMRVVATYE